MTLRFENDAGTHCIQLFSCRMGEHLHGVEMQAVKARICGKTRKLAAHRIGALMLVTIPRNEGQKHLDAVCMQLVDRLAERRSAAGEVVIEVPLRALVHAQTRILVPEDDGVKAAKLLTLADKALYVDLLVFMVKGFIAIEEGEVVDRALAEPLQVLTLVLGEIVPLTPSSAADIKRLCPAVLETCNDEIDGVVEGSVGIQTDLMRLKLRLVGDAGEW